MEDFSLSVKVSSEGIRTEIEGPGFLLMMALDILVADLAHELEIPVPVLLSGLGRPIPSSIFTNCEKGKDGEQASDKEAH